MDGIFFGFPNSLTLVESVYLLQNRVEITVLTITILKKEMGTLNLLISQARYTVNFPYLHNLKHCLFGTKIVKGFIRDW